jgi:hypothetical protein
VMAATLPVPENPPWCDGPGLSPEALVVMAWGCAPRPRG